MDAPGSLKIVPGEDFRGPFAAVTGYRDMQEMFSGEAPGFDDVLFGYWRNRAAGELDSLTSDDAVFGEIVSLLADRIRRGL